MDQNKLCSAPVITQCRSYSRKGLYSLLNAKKGTQVTVTKQGLLRRAFKGDQVFGEVREPVNDKGFLTVMIY